MDAHLRGDGRRRRHPVPFDEQLHEPADTDGDGIRRSQRILEEVAGFERD